MNVLFLDSTFKDLNVGLLTDNNFYKVNYEAFQRQSELMIPEIKKLLDENNIDYKDIQKIVVTNGPGSYTGLRIALTIAKIYGYITKADIHVLSSLEVLQQYKENSICLMNARSNRSYIGVYNGNSCLLEDQVLSNDEVKKYIESHPNYIVCGETEYLGINGHNSNILDNMKNLYNDSNKIKDVYELKAKYLKD